ncbi:auxin response factor 22-like [Andrographis paniculata]|uniref:auxin response factor 22-like n=1 Tax=Andrographis paniculata TaxID=175694 RepID=UPI0021E89CFA|nr:auxin response factor 22-like [Andrographis paniculata]XP_051120544.1 auxin response factor 22-like [Andrographis paniculata]XP_051120545.1 auxin response factor 22-like [Andrographis paniculata]
MFAEMKEMAENCLDSELWHACAGGMVQMPAVNSRVYYFPQGHAEHTLSNVDFGGLPRIPPMILCRVASLKYLADLETDEVYSKIGLIPVGKNDCGYDEDGGALGAKRSESTNEKPTSFAKTLTQSDANNGGGFSVPRYCAETIFPRLDYTADPPVQNVIVKDVHGETWKFRHIYRGTPRRHLLTTGWSSFVNQKKLVAGDSIVFLRAENGDLCVGIRRAKRGVGANGNESTSVWNSGSAGAGAYNYGGFSGFLEEDKKLLIHGNRNPWEKGKGKVMPESVLEAAVMAAKGQPFEVVYYPRASTPEYFVKASSVNAAMKIRWDSGMRFKMAFETEDSSRISWFMGTVTSVQVSDPIRWPNSLWRILQVAWDEPDLLQNVKCVSPWLVEMVASVPVLHLSPFSSPRKKLRLSQHPDFSLDGGGGSAGAGGRFPMPPFSGNPLGLSNPLCCLPDSISVGIQGVRHARIGVPSLDLQLSNKLQAGLFPFQPSVTRLDPHGRILDSNMARSYTDRNENISCLLTIGSSSKKSEKTDGVKTPLFILFGQPILTEQQMICDHSSFDRTEISPPATRDLTNALSTDQFLWKQGHHQGGELGPDTGHCKVFLESEDVGRTLDLSLLASYDDLYKKLEHMFGIERSEMLSRLFYHDATGAVKQSGEEPFSKFVRSAKRLTILTRGSSSNADRKLITGLPTAERGLDSSNQAGPMSIFA